MLHDANWKLETPADRAEWADLQRDFVRNSEMIAGRGFGDSNDDPAWKLPGVKRHLALALILNKPGCRLVSIQIVNATLTNRTSGWFRTGDIATLDQHGYMKIADRIKDLVKSGGEWISSVDLENALMAHPAVLEAAVIAAPHPKWDERPLAVVVLKPGQTATAEALREHLAPQFAKFWLPDAVLFVDAIPKTSTGKMLKATLREQYQNYFTQ